MRVENKNGYLYIIMEFLLSIRTELNNIYSFTMQETYISTLSSLSGPAHGTLHFNKYRSCGLSACCHEYYENNFSSEYLPNRNAKIANILECSQHFTMLILYLGGNSF